MTDDTEQRRYAEQAAHFIEYLTEILAKVAPPPPDELVQFANRLGGAQSKGERRPISNPAAFHRMCSILHRKTDPTMGELSDALSVTLSTATRMVSWLVDNGLAQRLPDPDDRRIVRVTLTDSGQRLHEAMQDHFLQNVQRIMACLTPEEQGIWIALFRKVASSLKASKT